MSFRKFMMILSEMRIYNQPSRIVHLRLPKIKSSSVLLARVLDKLDSDLLVELA